MIIVWFVQMVRFLARMVIPAPDAFDNLIDVTIDVNAKCPCCGHRSGKLTSVLLPDGKIYVQHHCNIDGSNWYEDPLVKDAHKFVYPQIVNPQ